MKIERIYELEIQGHTLRLSHEDAGELYDALGKLAGAGKNTTNLEWLAEDAAHHNVRRYPMIGSERSTPTV